MWSCCLALLSSSTSRVEVKNPEDEKQDYNNYYYSGKKYIIYINLTVNNINVMVTFFVQWLNGSCCIFS